MPPRDSGGGEKLGVGVGRSSLGFAAVSRGALARVSQRGDHKQNALNGQRQPQSPPGRRGWRNCLRSSANPGPGGPNPGDGDLAVQVRRCRFRRAPTSSAHRSAPWDRRRLGPPPGRGDWSTPPQAPAPYLRGRGYLGPPHVARVPRRRLLGPRPSPQAPPLRSPIPGAS